MSTPPKIRDTYAGCPTGWWIVDADTHIHIEANSYKNLRGKWEQHRKSNNLSTEGIDQMISDQLCKREAPEFCQEWPTTGTSYGTIPQPTLMEMMGNFASTIGYWASHGFPVATKEEFERRLSICQQCPHYDYSSFWGSGKCKKCGCCGGVKPHLLTAKCPDNPQRW